MVKSPVLAAGVVTAAAFVASKLKARKAIERKPCADQAAALPRPGPELARRPLQGVRVVELATVVAAPSATRCLAELGATVIKVEAPEGDMYRQLFIQMDGPPTTAKPHGSLFEVVNLSKASVQLDLKTPEDVGALRAMLADADVFVTNVRAVPLRKLGLDYEALRHSCPALVYAQLTAWGFEGEHRNRAGYDFGSFWAASGFAHHLHGGRPWRAMQVVGGFGDMTTGQTLVAGVSLALLERQSNGGAGQLVDTALLRAGMHCCAGEIVRADGADGGPGGRLDDGSDDTALPLECAGGEQVLISPLLDTQSGAPVRSAAAHRAAVRGALGLGDARADELGYAELRAAAAGLSTDALLSRLRHANVPAALMRTQMGAVRAPDKRTRPAPTAAAAGPAAFHPNSPWVTPPPGVAQVDGVTRMVRLPYHFSAGPTAGCTPTSAAPRKGEHTAAAMRALSSARASVWEPRAPTPPPPPPQQQQLLVQEKKLVLEGVLVVELSDELAARHDATASATCAMLAAAGATVVRVVSRADGSTVGVSSSALEAQLDSGKVLVSAHALATAGSSVAALCASADVIVTSLPDAALECAGRWEGAAGQRWSWSAVLERARPASGGELILTRITPWGVDDPGAEREAGEGGAADSAHAGIGEAMWACTGFGGAFANMLCDKPSGDTSDDAAAGWDGARQRSSPMWTLPRQSLALIASCFALAGTAAALCCRSRLGGQVVGVSYAAIGLWFVQGDHLFMRPENERAVTFQQLMRATPQSMANAIPPTFNTFRTFDGVYVQNLDLEWAGHLPKW